MSICEGFGLEMKYQAGRYWLEAPDVRFPISQGDGEAIERGEYLLAGYADLVWTIRRWADLTHRLGWGR